MRLRDHWRDCWKLRPKATQSYASYKALPAFESALRMKIQGGGGVRLLDLSKMPFFSKAGRGLSYWSCLTICIPGLVVRLVPCHTSATALTLHGWRLAEFQKHAFEGEGFTDIAKTWWPSFRLKMGTCLLTTIKVFIEERGRDGVTGI